MVPIVSLLLILGTSLLVTRIASVALEHTGLSRDAARFQARSAFTGVGFTTTESEGVVGHPVRRRIVMMLMLIGNVGIVSAMAAVLLSAIDLRSEQGVGVLAALLVGGIVSLSVLGTSERVDRWMCRMIRFALRRWTALEVEDYSRLLHLRDAYGVSRFCVESEDWVEGKTLGEARLWDEGLLVLGIECPGGTFIGAPPADVEMRVGDELVVYGLSDRVADLAARRRGDPGTNEHDEATEERQARVMIERERARR